MDISVVGTGYVGLVTGACLAEIGHQVICVDSDESKIQSLRLGESPIYEPGLPELVSSGRASGALSFTTYLDEAVHHSDVIFICVGTPPGSGGRVDLSQVEAVARALGANLDDRYRVIVNKSTVPVGCGNWVHALIRESVLENCRPQSPLFTGVGAGHSHSRGTWTEGGVRTRTPGSAARRGQYPWPDRSIAFDVVSNPEFLREGSAIDDMIHPDRIVIGSDSASALALMRELYAPIIEQRYVTGEGRRTVPLVETDLATAEMIKYAANAFLATKISFINEIAAICERVGAHAGQVADGIGLDRRIGRSFLNAGIGWGGSCFGKDVAALEAMAADYGYEARLLRAVRDVNARQRQWVVQKLQEQLKVLSGKTIGLLGLAFKPHTDDVRDAPAISIARQLLDLGARVRGLDPAAGPKAAALVPGLIVVPNALALAREADALLLLTEWPAFRDLDYARLQRCMRQPVLIDGRSFLDRRRLQDQGFTCVTIGQ